MGTSNYPGSLDDFATTSPTNLGDDDSKGRKHSERHDDLESAVENIQAELGTDPAGGAATVKDRITSINVGGLAGSHLWPTTARYYASMPWNTSDSSGNIALTANRLYFNAFWCQSTATLAALACKVTSGVSANARVGVYADSFGATGHTPGSLVVDAGTASVSTTGIKDVATTQVLNADTLYWLALVSDGTPNLEALSDADYPMTKSAGGSVYVAAGYQSFTYGALPASASTVTWLYPTAAPILWVKL